MVGRLVIFVFIAHDSDSSELPYFFGYKAGT